MPQEGEPLVLGGVCNVAFASPLGAAANYLVRFFFVVRHFVQLVIKLIHHVVFVMKIQLNIVGHVCAVNRLSTQLEVRFRFDLLDLLGRGFLDGLTTNF